MNYLGHSMLIRGHAKGGGALSAVAATQSPIIFIGCSLSMLLTNICNAMQVLENTLMTWSNLERRLLFRNFWVSFSLFVKSRKLPKGDYAFYSLIQAWFLHIMLTFRHGWLGNLGGEGGRAAAWYKLYLLCSIQNLLQICSKRTKVVHALFIMAYILC